MSRVGVPQFMSVLLSPFGFDGGMWNLLASVPDQCLSRLKYDSPHPHML